jgi:hypothetical protein
MQSGEILRAHLPALAQQRSIALPALQLSAAGGSSGQLPR